MNHIKKALAEIKANTKKRGPTDREISDALGILSLDYEDDVFGVACDLIEEYIGGSNRDASDVLHESIDGHSRLIYTINAKIGLLVSRNADAAAEEMGEDESGDTSQRMYFAMQQDVAEYLDAAGEPIEDLSGLKKGELRKALSSVKRYRGRKKSPTEKQVNDALSVLRADYYHDVFDQAEELIQRIADREITDTDGFDQALNEAVDGNRRVFVTYLAKRGLLSSDNEDAMEEELGSGAKSIEPERLMYHAFRSDVLQTMEAFGVNGTDDSTYEDE